MANVITILQKYDLSAHKQDARHNLFPANPDFQSDIMQQRRPAETPCFSN